MKLFSRSKNEAQDASAAPGPDATTTVVPVPQDGGTVISADGGQGPDAVDFATVLDSSVKEMSEKIARLTSNLESVHEERNSFEDKLTRMEERMRKLSALTEMISNQYNPFIGEEPTDGGDLEAQGPASTKKQLPPAAPVAMPLLDAPVPPSPAPAPPPATAPQPEPAPPEPLSPFGAMEELPPPEEMSPFGAMEELPPPEAGITVPDALAGPAEAPPVEENPFGPAPFEPEPEAPPMETAPAPVFESPQPLPEPVPVMSPTPPQPAPAPALPPAAPALMSMPSAPWSASPPSRRAHLEAIAPTFENHMVALSWANLLLKHSSPMGLMDLLGYYESLGWISKDVRKQLLTYAEGIAWMDTGASPDAWRGNLELHQRSLLFIERLKGLNVDEDNYRVLRRDIHRITGEERRA